MNMNMITSPAEIVIQILLIVWLALRIEIAPQFAFAVRKAAAVGVCVTVSGTGGDVANAAKTSDSFAKNISSKIGVRGRTGSDRP